MGKYFNVSAACKPELHYMVDITARLRQIRAMVDAGQYFTINRARQYGKTTTIRALGRYLEKDYLVVSLDFQKEMSAAKFSDENTFSLAFAKAFLLKIENSSEHIDGAFGVAVEELKKEMHNGRGEMDLVELFRYLSVVCSTSSKPLVLMIDEVDSAANSQVFLDFLAQLRGYYIDRDETATFQSVILAGVHDVKNIRRKLRTEEEHKVNSPWNIAADFLVDMSFSAEDIAGMLEEYEQDHGTGMDIMAMAQRIYDYTSGYPYLVSRLCKLMDERVGGGGEYPRKCQVWTKAGFLEAIRLLMGERNTLFDSLVGKIQNDQDLRNVLHGVIFQGKTLIYSPVSLPVEIAEMYGFFKNENGMCVIANRIFEMVLYNMFLSEEAVYSDMAEEAFRNKPMFVQKGRLNMKLVLEKFVEYFSDLYGDQGQRFYEEDGRRYFLLYLRPIINGAGNYYIEARTRNLERTDVVVDYGGEQFVIEMKLWRGEAYHRRGEEQLLEYLDAYRLKTGYMLSFNFNKKKVIGVKDVILGDKVLVEAVV